MGSLLGSGMLLTHSSPCNMANMQMCTIGAWKAMIFYTPHVVSSKEKEKRLLQTFTLNSVPTVVQSLGVLLLEEN